jgi:hypothetical protein
MNRVLRVWALAALLCVYVRDVEAIAQQGDPFRRVEVHVTAVSENTILIDRGSADGIAIGDALRLMPLGRPVIEGVIRSVSLSSSRALLEGDLDEELVAGLSGEVLVPVERGAAQSQTGDAPAHPPWKAPVEDWDPGQPLLAATEPREPDERPTLITGRYFLQSRHTWDSTGESDRRYLHARTGVQLNAENPFQQGGAMRFDGEILGRTADLAYRANEEELYLRPRWLSYTWGGRRTEPQRVELGRFQQHEFPEFGVLDGVEYGHRFGGGDRIAASVGYMPELDAEMRSGTDLQAAASYRFVSGPAEDYSAGVGYQKTWHEGEADRDLLIAQGDAHFTDSLSVFGTAWIDYYDSGDEIKSPGFELTQLQAHGRYAFGSDGGVGLHLSHVRWPELKRLEFTPQLPSLILDSRVTRLGLNGWTRVSSAIRLSGRVDRWEDETDDGGSFDLRADGTDLLWERGNLGLGIFHSVGAFTTATGMRLSASHFFAPSFLRIDWESANYDQETTLDGTIGLLQHALRANWDTTFGNGWNLSLSGESRFGDEQKSYGLGFFLQKRF